VVLQWNACQPAIVASFDGTIQSGRTARTSSTGDLILLEDQDRSLWNQSQMVEGRELVTRSLSSPEVGSYTLQAAIAAVHSEASNTGETDWTQVVALYDLLMQTDPSPIVELNRSVAV
jgi:RNA polymerase sigma-70 factor, ECF subfamily